MHLPLKSQYEQQSDLEEKSLCLCRLQWVCTILFAALHHKHTLLASLIDHRQNKSPSYNRSITQTKGGIRQCRNDLRQRQKVLHLFFLSGHVAQKHPSETRHWCFLKGLVRRNINIKAKQGGAVNIKLVISSCHRLPHGHEN